MSCGARATGYHYLLLLLIGWSNNDFNERHLVVSLDT